MAKYTRQRSSTLLIELLLLLASIFWCATNEMSRGGIDVSGSGSPTNAMLTALRCSAATVFGLLTVDCTARNISTTKQLLTPDLHDHVELLRLADNRLVRLGPDEFGSVTSHLQQLYLARNFISDIDPRAFRNLRILQVKMQDFPRVFELCNYRVDGGPKSKPLLTYR